MEAELVRAFANYINLFGAGTFALLVAYGVARVAEAMRITKKVVK